MLECGDGSLYTGWTNDIRKRLAAHRSGIAAKYTRGRGPIRLAYLEVHDTKSEAMRREVLIKRLTKAEKLALIQESNWKEQLDEWGLVNLEVEHGEPIQAGMSG
ncbi:MAG: GIY-YIG nuclease family protein [Lachnospiraceae bacterium]|nr:GIY-YIG nuclease family protein [Lachnospiraceae bacterium]